MTERLEIVIAAKDEFSRVFSGIKAQFAPIATGMAAAAAAAVGFGASMVALIKTTADEYDQLSKFSDKLGFSVEELSKLKYAASLADVSLEGMAMSLQFMQRFTAEAAAGNETNRETLAALGVELNKIRGQSPDEMFQTFAAAVAAIENPAERTRLAMEVFGRSGAEMTKMLKGGTEGLAELTKEAERFGAVVSTQAAYNSAEFNDSLTRVWAAAKGVRNEFSEQFIPVLTGAFNTLASYVANNRAQIVAWGADLLSILSKVAEVGAYVPALLIDAWRGLSLVWNGLKYSVADLALFMQNTWIGVIEGIKNVVASINDLYNRSLLPGVDPFAGAVAGLERFIGEAKLAKADLMRFQADVLANMEQTVAKGLATEQLAEFVENVKRSIRELGEAGTAVLSGSKTAPALNLGASKEGKDKLAADLAQLSQLWQQYYLTESERVDVWYAEQQKKFAGHKDALAMLEEVYAAKKDQLLANDLNQLRKEWDQHYKTESQRLDVWYAEQQQKFAGHQDALVTLEEVYTAKKNQVIANDMAQLNSMWEQYYLTESQRVDVWYAEQQKKFAENEEALIKLQEIYAEKKKKAKEEDGKKYTLGPMFRGIEESIKGMVGADKKEEEGREKIKAWYDEQIVMYGEFEDQRARIEEEYRQRSSDLDAQVLNERLEAYGNFMHQMAIMATALGKKGFLFAKALNIGQAIMSTYAGAANALKDYPYPYNIVAAAAVIAFGMAQVAKIMQQKPPEAHTGLDFVPREQTYMLSKGERVVQPQANKDLTEFLNSKDRGAFGGMNIENLHIEVFPNVTDARALKSMDEREMEEVVEEKILPAMRRLKFAGIRA